MHAFETSLACASFTPSPQRPIDEKGERAQVLFLIDAGLTVPKVIDKKSIVIASEAWQSPGLRSLSRNADEESRSS
jgi:hypothetical protein